MACPKAGFPKDGWPKAGASPGAGVERVDCPEAHAEAKVPMPKADGAAGWPKAG